jgi:actin
VLNLSSPFNKGIINNLEDMEKIWHHCFYDELKVTSEEHPVLLSDTPFNNDENKQQIT